MALINRMAGADYDTNSALYLPNLGRSYRYGEDVDEAAPAYFAADGFVYMSNGAAANTAAHCDGFTAKKAKAGDIVSLLAPGVVFEYGSGLTPGATLYIAATKGRLDDAPTTGDNRGVARVLPDGKHIRFMAFK